MTYKTYSFGELVEKWVDNRGKTPPLSDSGIPLLEIKHLPERGIYPYVVDTKFVDQTTYESWFRAYLEPEDVLFSTVGTTARVMMTPSEEVIAIAQNILGIRFKKNIVDPWFMFYYMRARQFQHDIESRLVITVQASIKRSDMIGIPVDVPAISIQQAIVKKVFSLDLKIDLNHQINQTLEQMAQAIFKSWFVDFEPVKAKMAALEAGGSEDDALLAAMQAIAGNALFASNAADADAATQLARLQAEHPEQYATLRATAELFPSTMQESELGKIPEGWGTGSFKDLCLTVESGGTPKRNTPEYWGGKIKWLASGEVRDVVVLDTKETITESGLKNSPAKLWPMYTTVVAMYGATAGQVCLIADQMTSNQACCGLIPKKNYKAFTFFSAKRSIQSLSDKASGSAQQNLNKGLVEGHQTILPAETILVVYEDLVFPLMLKWIENIRESVMLAEARDTLLPKLLSGELSVSAAADQINKAEEAVNVQS